MVFRARLVKIFGRVLLCAAGWFGDEIRATMCLCSCPCCGLCCAKLVGYFAMCCAAGLVLATVRRRACVGVVGVHRRGVFRARLVGYFIWPCVLWSWFGDEIRQQCVCVVRSW